MAEEQTRPGAREQGDEPVHAPDTQLDGEPRRMPTAVEKLEEHGNGGLPGEMMARGNAVQSAMPDQAHTMSSTNGDAPLINGSLVNGHSPMPPASSQQTHKITQLSVTQLPPEVQHLTLGYLSMQHLVGRLVQETFNGLGDVINDMAEIPMPQPQTNGLLNQKPNRSTRPLSEDSSHPNIQKKARMFDFANSRRAQFIKILILSRWARHAQEIRRVIDLKSWLEQKSGDYMHGVYYLGELKHHLSRIKEPSPDIKTALEILSLGEANRVPDIGYLQPKELSAQQALDTLRRINTLLSIRLNLHESIPSVLRNFHISSGRATFNVPAEFELDLSIADEDHSKQLYFIDLRFVFSPAPPALPAGRLREDFEMRANDLLRRERLPGLFDYIHNLVLTHKLNILKTQAFEMARGPWCDNLQVEPVRRSFVVQYWCDRPEGKHWIEIGIKRGKAKRVPYTDEVQRIPEISLRWFRGGKEIPNVVIDLRLHDLSMQAILGQVIARHTSMIFSGIATNLTQSSLFANNRLRIRLREATGMAPDASLLVQITASKAVKLVQEQVSGRLVLLPSSNRNSQAEHELNRLTDPAADGGGQLTYLRACVSQDEAEATARSAGWRILLSMKPTNELLQTVFHKEILRAKFFEIPHWNSGWMLAATTSKTGDVWWAVDTNSSAPLSEGSQPGSVLRKAYKVQLAGTDPSILLPSAAYLGRVERAAAGLIAQFSDTRHLVTSKTPHRVQPRTAADGVQQAPDIYMQLHVGHGAPTLQQPNSLTLGLNYPVLKLHYMGLNPSHTAAVHLGLARLTLPTSYMKRLVRDMPGMKFHAPTGMLIIKLETKIGATCITQLWHHVAAIGQLQDFIATVSAYKLQVNRSSINHLEFTYQRQPIQLKATLYFPAGNAVRISFSQPNPHARILDQINVRLRTQGLANVLSLLRITLPLLSTFSKLEMIHQTGGMSIMARSDQWYLVRYSGPYLDGGFEVLLRQRRDVLKWLIPESSIKSGHLTGVESSRKQWQDIKRGKGSDWQGLNGGIVAGLVGIQEVVEKLDMLFSQLPRPEPQSSRPGKRKADGEVVEID